MILLPAFALERTGYRHRLQTPVLLSTVIGLTLAHAVSIMDVFQRTRARDSRLTWLFPHLSVMFSLAILGCFLCVAAVVAGWPARPGNAPEATDKRELVEAGAAL